MTLLTPSNIVIGALVAMLLGAFAGWLVHRLRASDRRNAAKAFESEVVRAAACARDRAREEKEIMEDRLARLMLEHEKCRDTIAATEARLKKHDAAIEAVKQERDAAIEARDAEAAGARKLKELTEQLEWSIEERKREEGAPSWLDKADGFNRDDLTAIRGLGNVLELRLNRLGIYRYRQLARMTTENTKWVASRIRVLGGRIVRDRWAQQARRMHQSKYDEPL
jgi:predicted flap endonuclease-1-like 5' DNA nuclease